MNGKTEGIVLGLRKKGDNQTLVEVYTRENGRAAFFVYGNKYKSALMPLSFIELTYTCKPTAPIPTLSSAQRLFLPIHDDVPHYCVAMFIAEVLEKSLRHPMQDETLFEWLVQCIKKLDQTDELHTFPRTFLVALSQQLGYGGEMLDEWQNLKSSEVIHHVFQE